MYVTHQRTVKRGLADGASVFFAGGAHDFSCAAPFGLLRSVRLFLFFTHIMAKSPDETPAAPAAKNSKPVETFRHFGISASVFENTSQKGGKYFSVSLQKRFKPDEGDWQTTPNFMRDELPVLQELTRQAYAFILAKESTRSTDTE